jgi:hypothetical protein
MRELASMDKKHYLLDLIIIDLSQHLLASGWI